LGLTSVQYNVTGLCSKEQEKVKYELTPKA
jgi:hypothetical protein